MSFVHNPILTNGAFSNQFTYGFGPYSIMQLDRILITVKLVNKFVSVKMLQIKRSFNISKYITQANMINKYLEIPLVKVIGHFILKNNVFKISLINKNCKSIMNKVINEVELIRQICTGIFYDNKFKNKILK